MAVLESTPETLAADTDAAMSQVSEPAAPAVGAGVRTAALVQWAVVGSLLAYGVSQTAVKAAALFG